MHGSSADNPKARIHPNVSNTAVMFVYSEYSDVIRTIRIAREGCARVYAEKRIFRRNRRKDPDRDF